MLDTKDLLQFFLIKTQAPCFLLVLEAVTSNGIATTFSFKSHSSRTHVTALHVVILFHLAILPLSKAEIHRYRKR